MEMRRPIWLALSASKSNQVPGVEAIDNTAVRMPASSICSAALLLDQATWDWK